MGTSQSKRSNKSLSKLRTSSVGAADDFDEETNNIGKISSFKGKATI